MILVLIPVVCPFLVPKTTINATATKNQNGAALHVSTTNNNVYSTSGDEGWAVDTSGVTDAQQQMAVWNFTESRSVQRFDLWFGAVADFRIVNGSIYYTTVTTESIDWLTLAVTGDASTGFKALDINSIIIKNSNLDTGTCPISAGEPHHFYDCNTELVDDVFYNLTFDATSMTAFRLNVSKDSPTADNFILGEVDFVLFVDTVSPEISNITCISCYVGRFSNLSHLLIVGVDNTSTYTLDTYENASYSI